MSLQTTPSERQPPKRTADRRINGKLKAGLDLMVWEGLTYQDAAAKADLTVRAMRLALDRPHVLAYLKAERMVLHASMSGWADFRMRELAAQNKNMAAAVSATKELRGFSDQEHSAGAQRHAPGLVVQIITAAPTPPTIDLVRNTCDDENS